MTYTGQLLQRLCNDMTTAWCYATSGKLTAALELLDGVLEGLDKARTQVVEHRMKLLKKMGK